MTPQEKTERERLADLIMSCETMKLADRKRAAKFIIGNTPGRPRGVGQKAIDQAVVYLEEYRRGGTKAEIRARAMHRIEKVYGSIQSKAAFDKTVERYIQFAQAAEPIKARIKQMTSNLQPSEE